MDISLKGLEDFVDTEDQQEENQNEEQNEEQEQEQEGTEKDETPDPDPSLTSGQEDKEDVDEDSVNFINELKTEYGIEGEYSATPDGFKEILKAVKEKADEVISTYENPVVKEFAEYVAKGGNPANFGDIVQEIDWENQELPKEGDDAEQIQENVIRIAMERKNNSPRMIKNAIDAAKAAGELFEAAEEELTWLKTQDEERVRINKERINTERVEAARKQKEDNDAIVSIVDKGIIDGYKLEPKEIKALKEHIFPDKANAEKVREKYANLSKEKKVLLEYLILNDLNLEVLAGKKAPSKVETVKKEKEKGTGISALFKTSSNKSSNSDDNDYDLLDRHFKQS